MPIDKPVILRAAGWSALAGLVALILAALTLALFFGGAGAAFGSLNDLLSAIALALLLLPILAVWILVRTDAGGWFSVVSLIALLGTVVAVAGQLALVAGLIGLEASFVTGGIGFVPILAWLVALAAVALRSEALPDLVGWLTVAVLAMIALTAAATTATTGLPVTLLSVVLVVVLAGWLVALAKDFLGRA